MALQRMESEEWDYRMLPLWLNGCEIQARCWIKNSPVDKHSATSIKRVLNEVIAGWEVLEQVFIVDVVYFDDLVVVILEKILI